MLSSVICPLEHIASDTMRIEVAAIQNKLHEDAHCHLHGGMRVLRSMSIARVPL